MQEQKQNEQEKQNKIDKDIEAYAKQKMMREQEYKKAEKTKKGKKQQLQDQMTSKLEKVCGLRSFNLLKGPYHKISLKIHQKSHHHNIVISCSNYKSQTKKATIDLRRKELQRNLLMISKN